MKFLRISAGTIFGLLFTFSLLSLITRPITAPLKTCERETNNTGRCYDHIGKVLQFYYANPTRTVGTVFDMVVIAIPTALFGLATRQLLFSKKQSQSKPEG